MDLARGRYSVRKFDGRPVTEDVLAEVLEAGRLAPTAANNQPQRVYVLRSEKAIEKANALSRCIYGAATVLLVAYNAEEDWKNPNQEGVHSGEQDASIVACHMMLRAAELGVGSVWVNMFSPDEAARAFDLPDTERVVLMMPLGYPAEGAKPAKWHADKKPLSDTVRYI